MKYWFIGLLFLLSPTLAYSGRPPFKVAVIDTGLDVTDARFRDHICGYEDETGKGIEDRMGHGTHVTGLIEQYAKDANYCLIIIKYTNDITDSNEDVARAVSKSYNALYKFKPDVVNFSSSGSMKYMAEFAALNNLPNIKFFVAAGNDHVNIDENPRYPACYHLPNIFPVGSVHNGVLSSFSDYGDTVKYWEDGENVLSTLPGGYYGQMSGTSMSTAIHTGKYIYENNM